MNVCVFLFSDGRNLKYQITTITCVSRSFWVSYVYVYVYVYCVMCISSLVSTLNSSCAWLPTYLCIKLLLVHMVVLWYRSRKMRTKCHFREHLKEQKWKCKEPGMNIESTAVPIPKNTNHKMRISDNFFYLVHVSEVDARKESNEKASHKRKFKTI